MNNVQTKNTCSKNFGLFFNYIFDCGLKCISVFRSNVQQRRGRAGRCQPGKFFKLYSKLTFTSRSSQKHFFQQPQKSIESRYDAIDLVISVGTKVKCFCNSLNVARIGAKLCQNAISDDTFRFRHKNKSTKTWDRNACFSTIWPGFWLAMSRTSKSASSSNFALDRLIQRSVHPKNLEFGSNLGSGKNFHLRYQVSTFLGELFPQPHI